MDKFYNKLVKKSLSNNNTKDFKTFLKNCNGCFVVDCVKILKNENNFQNKKQKILQEIKGKPQFDKSQIYKHINYKPTPHMLDSDWRFTYRTQNYIINKISKYIPDMSKCLLVGTPSLLHNRETLTNKFNITFLEKNITSIDFKNKIVMNLLDYVSNIKFEAIICDPPWYKNAYLNFIYKFSTMISKNGLWFLIFPPKGVRQSIDEERFGIINFAKSIGFELIEEDIETINYYSSPFEINSILDNGITNFPIDWRYGNLFIFKLKEYTNIPFQYIPIPENNKWNEYIINNIRFKVLDGQLNAGKPVLEKIYRKDILPSVSMRNKKIKEIGLWTSGNRVYKCNNSKLLCSILDYRTKNSFKICCAKFKDSVELVNLIEDIINKEYEEYGQYWN